jgi:hypothetical protein
MWDVDTQYYYFAVLFSVQYRRSETSIQDKTNKVPVWSVPEVSNISVFFKPFDL